MEFPAPHGVFGCAGALAPGAWRPWLLGRECRHRRGAESTPTRKECRVGMARCRGKVALPSPCGQGSKGVLNAPDAARIQRGKPLYPSVGDAARIP